MNKLHPYGGFDKIGMTQEEVIADLRKGTHGIIDDTTLQSGAARMLESFLCTGIDPRVAYRYIRESAKYSMMYAQTYGWNAGSTFDILTTGLIRCSAMILVKVKIKIPYRLGGCASMGRRASFTHEAMKQIIAKNRMYAEVAGRSTTTLQRIGTDLRNWWNETKSELGL